MSLRKKCVWIFLLGTGLVLYQWSIVYKVNSNFYGIKRRNTVENIRPVVSDQPIIITSDSEIGLIKGKKEMEIKESGYLRYAFNILVSDRIGFNRSIPDTRDEKCAAKMPNFSHKLKTSVVICFFNEAWSTLLRTIYSVIQRSPEGLLHEIILIDDKSTEQDLIFKLPIYLDKYLPVVKLFRVKNREGLIRARLKGAEHASGDVLVFLDSHCEVNTYWLEPLLSRISNDRKTVVCPVIDTINSHTFEYEYEAAELVRGGFNWGMHFNWESVPASQLSDKSQPYISPTMAGGLFAIDRKYFFELGSYDKSMDVWGGENLEISFRIWMCGGRLEIVPCSRVGHVFRDRRPYGNNGEGDTMSRNTVRLVEVWLDDYKEHFYSLRPELKSLRVDVSTRKNLRRDLKCKSFKWYLDTVYPELGIPMVRDGAPIQLTSIKDTPPRVKAKLQNVGLIHCFNVLSGKKPKKVVILSSCQEVSPVRHTFDNEIKVGKRLCLDVALHTYTKKQARLSKCHGSKDGQEWRYKTVTQQLYNPALGMCLAGNDLQVITQICDVSSATQKWRFMD